MYVCNNSPIRCRLTEGSKMKNNHTQVAGRDRKSRSDKSDTEKKKRRRKREKEKFRLGEKKWNKIKQEIHKLKNIPILNNTEIHEAKIFP